MEEDEKFTPTSPVVRATQQDDIDGEDTLKVDDMATSPERVVPAILNSGHLCEHHTDKQNNGCLGDCVQLP